VPQFHVPGRELGAPQKATVKVEVSPKGNNIRYIFTNLTNIRAKQLYEKGYCARGVMELRIMGCWAY